MPKPFVKTTLQINILNLLRQHYSIKEIAIKLDVRYTSVSNYLYKAVKRGIIIKDKRGWDNCLILVDEFGYLI